MKHPKMLVCAAGLVVLVAGGFYYILGSAQNHKKPKQSRMTPPLAAQADLHPTAQESWVDVGRDGAEAAVLALGDAAFDSSEQVLHSTTLQQSFQNSLEELLSAYFSDSYETLKAYMILHDIEPPDMYVNNPKQSEGLWSHWQKMVSDAKFDVENITVIRGHRSVKKAPPGYVNAESVREGSRPTIETVSQNNLEHIEVHIPGIYHSPFTDDTFHATLGLEFVRSKDHKWVLLRTSWYDVPLGVPTVPVPL